MNNIKLSGEIISIPEVTHEFHGEKFYEFYIKCERNSGAIDILPCIAPYIIIKNIEKKLTDGNYISLVGEIRTRNEHLGQKNKLKIYVFVERVDVYIGFFENFVVAQGAVCKDVVYRKTPLGREIADLILASNRERNDRSDYIPCIAWGRNALRAADMPIGARLTLEGRLQSRNYIKCFEDGTDEIRTAYELSCSSILPVYDDEVLNGQIC